VGLVLDPVTIANSPNILAAIGIQEVTAKHVFDQLLVLANTNLSSSVGLEDMCQKLYTYIDPTDPIRHLSTEENKVPGDEKASCTDLRSPFQTRCHLLGFVMTGRKLMFFN
jgi:hypothetical protein